MKRILVSLLFFAVLTAGCAGSRNTETAGKETEQMEREQRQLLTAAELVRLVGIEDGQYSTDVLEQFIADYEVTAVSVGTLNIPLLLEEYGDISGIRDISFLLHSSAEERTSDYTEDVIAIAYYENIGTGSECVYYDLEEGSRYRTTDMYLFSNLRQAEPESDTRGRRLAEQLEELGVFSWTSVSDTEGMEDIQSMTLAVAYEDGTVFRVAAEGILSQILPETYAQVRELLLEG